MRIGIIGYGVVGKAIDYTLSKRYNIIKYDKYIECDSFEELSSCSFVFVSVSSIIFFRLNIPLQDPTEIWSSDVDFGWK